jgi:hypothetical protein
MRIALFDKIILVVSNLGNFAIKVGLALSVIALIYVGYRYFLSAAEVKKTHLSLIFVIIGILIILLVIDIPTLLKEILNSQS